MKYIFEVVEISSFLKPKILQHTQMNGHELFFNRIQKGRGNPDSIWKRLEPRYAVVCVCLSSILLLSGTTKHGCHRKPVTENLSLTATSGVNILNLSVSHQISQMISEDSRESLTEAALNRYNTHSPSHTNSTSNTNSPSHTAAVTTTAPPTTTSAAASFFAR